MNTRVRIADMGEIEAKIDRIVSKRFSKFFMSDAKWRKLFMILRQQALGIEQLLWKYVDNEHVIRWALPGFTRRRHLFSGQGGETHFKSIEWIEIPEINVPYGWEKIPYKHRTQNVEGAIEALERTGKFELERTDKGVRIYEYR